MFLAYSIWILSTALLLTFDYPVWQAEQFNRNITITGLVLTKLDGTARGGAVVSVVDTLGLPVKFVGVGEGLDDL